MKVFYADTSLVGNYYFAGQDYTRQAKAVVDRFNLRPRISELVRLEMRLACLSQDHEQEWPKFSDHVGKIWMLHSVNWESLFAAAASLVLQHGRGLKPTTLDTLHVMAARQLGATHFLSVDCQSRQRAFAKACGLHLVPERMSGD